MVKAAGFTLSMISPENQDIAFLAMLALCITQFFTGICLIGFDVVILRRISLLQTQYNLSTILLQHLTGKPEIPQIDLTDNDGRDEIHNDARSMKSVQSSKNETLV